MTIQSAIDDLRNLLGEAVSTNAAILLAHGQNEGYFPVTPPDAVVFATSTEQVSAAMRICARHRCPVTPWGTGTSLEGHQLAVQGGISLNTSRMDRVLAVNAQDMDAVVQPGVTRTALNTALRGTGLFFAVDPGADAALGGMVATRASGTTAVRYGTMREATLALQVVLADGRVIRTGTRARKSSAGYDLTRLFVGSEGTLGIITEATLRLFGLPEAISAATCRFPDISAAVDTVIATIQMGIPVARIEFVDEMMARGFNLLEGAGLPEVPHLFVEFHGSAASVAEQAETFGALARNNGADGFSWATREEDRTRLWRMRHRAYYAQKAHRPQAQVQNTDVCVPISRLAEALRLARETITRLGLSVSMVGHVGDGNFHCGINLSHDNPEEMARAAEFSHRLAEQALALGGTVSGEHGIGIGKMKYMQAEHGEALSVMADIKRLLDPHNILNPGKMIPPA